MGTSSFKFPLIFFLLAAQCTIVPFQSTKGIVVLGHYHTRFCSDPGTYGSCTINLRLEKMNDDPLFASREWLKTPKTWPWPWVPSPFSFHSRRPNCCYDKYSFTDSAIFGQIDSYAIFCFHFPAQQTQAGFPDNAREIFWALGSPVFQPARTTHSIFLSAKGHF